MSYLDYIENILRLEELEDVAEGTSVRKLTVGPETRHLYLIARQRPDAEDFYLDIWRMAHLRHVRVIELLIKALGYHESRVQDVADRFLAADVDARVHALGLPLEGISRYELHTLVVYERWNKWWAKNGQALSWDQSKRKYIVRK